MKPPCFTSGRLLGCGLMYFHGLGAENFPGTFTADHLERDSAHLQRPSGVWLETVEPVLTHHKPGMLEDVPDLLHAPCRMPEHAVQSEEDLSILELTAEVLEVVGCEISARNPAPRTIEPSSTLDDHLRGRTHLPGVHRAATPKRSNRQSNMHSPPFLDPSEFYTHGARTQFTGMT